MGDGEHNRHGPKRGGCCSPCAGELNPRLTQYSLGRGLYFHNKRRLHPSSRLATVDKKDRKPKGLCTFMRGELRPHLTQRRLGRVYLRTQWHVDPSSRLATIDMDQNWVGAVLFSAGSWVSIEQKVAWAEAYLHAKWHYSPSTRLATTDIG